MSRGQAINTFGSGLVSDLNAITTPNNVLTDALNGAFLTMNGNELVLQNDMGNTDLIIGSGTDKVSLSEGFIPIGMKEHGGIIYIVSHNPSTSETEIGSFPGPIHNGGDPTEDAMENTKVIVSTATNNEYPSTDLFSPKLYLNC